MLPVIVALADRQWALTERGGHQQVVVGEEADELARQRLSRVSVPM